VTRLREAVVRGIEEITRSTYALYERVLLRLLPGLSEVTARFDEAFTRSTHALQ
jgi:hypothetical protein